MMELAPLLPRPGDEAFKYTSFAVVARRSYRAPGAIRLDAATLPKSYGVRLCFVDGRFHEASSDLSGLPDGVTVTRSAPKPTLHDANALARMNAVLADDGLTISIAPDRILDAPIEVLFVSSAHEGDIAANTCLQVEAGHHSRFTLIERHIGLGDSPDFLNVLTSLDLDRSADVTHVLVQSAPAKAVLATGLYATLASDARLTSHAIQLGGGLVRTDIQARLSGRGAYCGLYGLHLAGMKQHIDTHTRIDHLVPDTSSDEHYRAIVDRGGRSVFNGKVVVATGADRTDAQQYNANLLLSEQAEVDTKPELEIYADDVKCAHGATVGRLDETALFYLRSRGIGLDAARSVLVWAFAETVLSKVPVGLLRDETELEVLKRLPNAERIQEFR